MSVERILEDSLAIRMVIQRLYLANEKVTLAFHEHRGEFQILGHETDGLSVAMGHQQFGEWGLAKGEKMAMNLEDRGFKYEAVIHCDGVGEAEGFQSCLLAMPRSLRRADSHRLTDFAPDTAPVCTFSNSRSALLDGQVKGFGLDGMEVSFKDSRQKIQDVLRMGEESTLEVPLEGDLRLMAPTRVAYFGDTYVGLQFTEKADKELLGQYRNWLEHQQQLQVQRDRESFSAGQGKKPARGTRGAELPQVRPWVERAPAILILTEKEDFARRMAEGLGRKFGILSLDYITGKVRPFLKEYGGEEDGWGRVRLILIHNHLRLVSPLELSRQLVEQEKCPLPVVLAGTEEDLELKQNRALAHGAVDYIPVDPFKILTILKKVDETLRMFEG